MKGRLINRYLRYLIGRDLCEIESFVIFEAMDCNVESIFKNFYRERGKENWEDTWHFWFAVSIRAIISVLLDTVV